MQRLAFLIALTLSILVVACGGSGSSDTGTDPGSLDVPMDVSPDVPVTPDVIEVATDPGTDTGPDVPLMPTVLRKGPYLQLVTDTSVEVLVEVSLDPGAGALVQVGPAGGATTIDHTVPMAFAEILKDSQNAPAPGTFQGIASLTGLAAATTYHYCVVVDATPRCDTFRTAPAALSTTPFTFVAYGDTRTDDVAHQKVIDHIVAGTPRPDFAIQTGDLDEFGADLDLWQTFFTIESKMLSFTPYFPVVGNHEDILYGLDYYQAWFDLPKPLGDELNYSFVHGNAAFVCLDTQVDITTGPIFDWMTGELTKFQDAGYLIFVVTHEPVYSFALHGEYAGGVEKLAPEYEKYGVVAVLSGHNHLYEHFLANGIHYFTLGGGGAPLYDADSNVIDAQKQYEVKALSVHHHMMAEVAARKVTLTVQNDDAPEVIETIVIDRTPTP